MGVASVLYLVPLSASVSTPDHSLCIVSSFEHIRDLTFSQPSEVLQTLSHALNAKAREMASTLRADLHVTSMIPISVSEPPPFGIPQTWSHMASTLIHGDKEALLTDPPLTLQQGEELAAWVKTIIPKNTLTTVFVTHGHGDHCCAIGPLLKHFPGAHCIATHGTVEHMKA